MPHQSPFRVELRQPRRRIFLGTVIGARPHRRSLDPFLSRVLQNGERGWLVLINEDTGQVVARRRVALRAATG
jgi:hypothetical protein